MTATAIIIQSADELAAIFDAMLDEMVTLEHMVREQQRVTDDGERFGITYEPVFSGRTGYVENVERVGTAGVRVVINGAPVYLYGDHPVASARPFRVTIH